MKLKRYTAIVSAIVFLFSLFTAIATGEPGSAGDPVISLQYIQKIFIPSILGEVGTRAGTAYNGKIDAAAAKVQAAINDGALALNEQQMDDRIVYAAYMQMIDNGFCLRANPYALLTLSKGECVVVAPNGSFTVREGSARITGDPNAILINVTAGAAAGTNSTAAKYAKYIPVEDGIVSVKAVADRTTIAVEGNYQLIPSYQAEYTDIALVLKSIDLFRGTNLGFELEREPTRLEALIMFLRLIGEEQQALAWTGPHPFTDVPKWTGDKANKYVAYAYEKGYTKGMSKTLFGSTASATAEQYITFVLRALGYKDGTDFTWNVSTDKAEALGILADGDKEKIQRRGFYRDHVAYVSYYSLQAKLKDGSAELIRTLINKGLLSPEEADTAVKAIPR